jgi:hypothetical protein
MSFQAELYAIVPQDLALMDVCFRPMDFVSKDYYIWRSAEEVRAFFEPKGLLFKKRSEQLGRAGGGAAHRRAVQGGVHRRVQGHHGLRLGRAFLAELARMNV